MSSWLFESGWESPAPLTIQESRKPPPIHREEGPEVHYWKRDVVNKKQIEVINMSYDV